MGSHSKKTAFLFPGQGSYTDTTLSEILKMNPGFSKEITVGASIIRKYFEKDLAHYIYPQVQTGKLESLDEDFEMSQCAIFLIGYFMSKIVRDMGIEPDFMVGHSTGEIPAMTASGVFSFEDGMRITCERTSAILKWATKGRMMAVRHESHRVQMLLSFLGLDDLSIAVINDNSQTVLSGTSESIAKVSKIMDACETSGTILKSNYPFHSTLMMNAASKFHDAIRGIQCNRPGVALYSPILGRFYNEDDNILEHLANHFVRPVRFKEAIAALYKVGVRRFIETGGKSALTTLTKSILELASDYEAVECNPKGLSVADGLQRLGGIKTHVKEVEAVAELNTRGLVSSNESLSVAVKRIYQDLTGYPEEVLELDADFESELGLDSVKQLEILARVFKDLGLNRPEVFEIAKYNTINKVAAHVASLSGESPAVDGGSQSVPAHAKSADVRGDLTVSIKRIYQELTGYPEEVLELDADFESELGLDSVKQLEILARVFKDLGMEKPEVFEIAKYNTINKVAAYVQGLSANEMAAAA